MGERLVRNEEVSGSIPLGSTNPPDIQPETTFSRAQAMIGSGGKPLSKNQLHELLGVYNSGRRGSKEFGQLPRALVIVLDNLAIGKTTYVKAADGQMQLSRRKDKTVVAT